ncbi:FliM/FliN family flagellar motor switch protein [Amphiplicatus metriothermophilus]|uniref:Flagellar motor switch protein FliN n=1 Tax=Amphiplicatus metriothermophilus TaxID=1519374 RepID=A0A239PKM8_9PROT|nr:FliM/FliN family flagellar motor switch protein [Amphiplicatus metriothermophilus]MBB5517308.1 flagellar motor switch protein FliN [Amphiplicatus metriothermophilus]SNT68356.1 flagellar motor switch protein FliN [Amphiplicatus metriothermophilus]
MSESEAKDDEKTVTGEAAGESDGAAPHVERREGGEANRLRRAIFSVPIEVVVSVGSARPLLGDLLNMERGHLLPLDASLDDPVELRVKDRVIARGELTQLDNGREGIGVRITEIVDMSEIV